MSIYNRQRAVKFDLSRIRRIADAAQAACVAAARSGSSLLKLRAVDVTILSDSAIGRVHRDFLDDASPTDVITFEHGELLLGAGVLVENAARYGHSPSDEAALCVIHGVLHLGGWNDLSSREAREMAKRQEQIFKQALRMVD